jgi:hypothetical protein
VGFASYAQDPIAELIATASGGGKVTLLVGAGASMEAGLPSWHELLDRLVVRAGEVAGLIEAAARNEQLTHEQGAERARWLSDAARDGSLGKAALAEALAGGERDAWIKEALFGSDSGPHEYFPGPIATQVPILLEAFGPADLRVMTLNYDDLIEQAFRDRAGAPAPHALSAEDHHVPSGGYGIFHLHGYLGRDDRPSGELVLSEADYMQMQRGTSWQETLVQTALHDSTLVFVGTSLLDPNVIRYLHGVTHPTGSEPARFAVFARQDTYPEPVRRELRDAREWALAKRWEAIGVRAVFVDHYTDVAQLLAEIARRRALGSAGYTHLPGRAREWIDRVEREILGRDDDERFRDSQRVVNRLLQSALRSAVAEAERLSGRRWSETLQLGLWLVDPEGERLTNWVVTDRLHLDRRTVEPVPIDEYSDWLAVRSFCVGTSLAEARDVYSSRWKFILSTPLVLESERYGRVPVGCLTTASRAAREHTNLERLYGEYGEVLAAFNDTLSETVLTLLGEPFAPVAAAAPRASRTMSGR